MTQIAAGHARFPGRNVQEIIQTDAVPPGEEVAREGYAFLGDRDLDFERYVSPEFFKLEIERMWSRTWQWACREEHIPEEGDYHVYDVGPYSVLVVRTESGEIKAFRNACMHRGTQLRPCGSEGNAQEFRCPYHGWTWSLEGALKKVPCEWDFPHVSPDSHGLTPVRAECWGGFVFINLDPAAPPLLEYLDPLPSHFPGKFFEQRYVAIHVQKELKCNWKIATEAFLESYHVMETHPQFMPSNGDADCQYDILSDYVSRHINLGGVASELLDSPVSEQEILDDYMINFVGRESFPLPEGMTARQMIVAMLRDAVAAQYGIDASNIADTELVDARPYSVFPNQQFFLGYVTPFVYRFRPLDMRHDRCLFDLLILAPRPRDGSPVETAEPHRLTADESFSTVPGVSGSVALVFDQDTGNVAAAQLGMMASGKKGPTLANYQEVRIRHLHRTLDAYLASPPAGAGAGR